MRGFVLADWTTVSGTSTTTTVTQSEDDYLDLSAFQDFQAWVEVDSIVAGGAPAPTLLLETAPLKEDVLFIALATGWRQASVALAPGVLSTKNVLNAATAKQIPLARWLRWRVDMSSAASTWSVTFRVHVAAHSVCLVGS